MDPTQGMTGKMLLVKADLRRMAGIRDGEHAGDLLTAALPALIAFTIACALRVSDDWVIVLKAVARVAAKASSRFKKTNPVYIRYMDAIKEAKEELIRGLVQRIVRDTNTLASVLQTAFPNPRKVLDQEPVLKKLTDGLPSLEAANFAALQKAARPGKTSTGTDTDIDPLEVEYVQTREGALHDYDLLFRVTATIADGGKLPSTWPGPDLVAFQNLALKPPAYLGVGVTCLGALITQVCKFASHGVMKEVGDHVLEPMTQAWSALIMKKTKLLVAKNGFKSSMPVASEFDFLGAADRYSWLLTRAESLPMLDLFGVKNMNTFTVCFLPTLLNFIVRLTRKGDETHAQLVDMYTNAKLSVKTVRVQLDKIMAEVHIDDSLRRIQVLYNDTDSMTDAKCLNPTRRPQRKW